MRAPERRIAHIDRPGFPFGRGNRLAVDPTAVKRDVDRRRKRLERAVSKNSIGGGGGSAAFLLPPRGGSLPGDVLDGITSPPQRPRTLGKDPDM